MLNKNNAGLVVVDIQGKLAQIVANSDAFLSNCAKLIEGAQALGLPIVWLEQNPDKLGKTSEQIASQLTAFKPITKFTFDGCEEPPFVKEIEDSERTSWLICGIEAHICVYQTAMGLKALDYDIHLVSDCVSSREDANKQLAMNKLSAAGVEITGLEMCLYELVKDCRAPAFKHILNLIK